jgi:hypothetical protein
VNSNIFTRIFGYSTVLSDLGLDLFLILILRILNWFFLNIPRRFKKRFDEDTRYCIIVVFRAKHFEKFEIFGVVNSNIFTRIFGYSTVLSDLDLKDLELVLLEHPRRFKEDLTKLQDVV